MSRCVVALCERSEQNAAGWETLEKYRTQAKLSNKLLRKNENCMRDKYDAVWIKYGILSSAWASRSWISLTATNISDFHLVCITFIFIQLANLDIYRTKPFWPNGIFKRHQLIMMFNSMAQHGHSSIYHLAGKWEISSANCSEYWFPCNCM